MATILVVDDEASLREVFGQALQADGHTVQFAANGQQAIDQYRQDGPAIDLVLLDVRMPGLDGVQTLNALRQLDPNVRCCLMCSETCGYPIPRLLASGALDILSKPVPRLADLTEAVRGMLPDSSPTSA